MPNIQKFVQVRGLLTMLDELNAGYRQVFTDGRSLPQEVLSAVDREVGLARSLVRIV